MRQVLEQRGLTLALAESCTGGLLGALLTEAPGASRFFRGSVVAYDDQVKIRVLGVPSQVLEQHGAVSRACVLAMARAVRGLLESDVGVALSGICGPQGGSPQKPVGTVWMALSLEAGEVAQPLALTGDRTRIRWALAGQCLEWMGQQLTCP